MLWKGDKLIDKVTRAAAEAIDETTAAAVNRAKSDHPFVNRTGTLEGSIQMRPAERDRDGIHGEFGSYGVDYAIHVEMGTVNTPGGYPFLRPAADEEFPKLQERIGKRLK